MKRNVTTFTFITVPVFIALTLAVIVYRFLDPVLDQARKHPTQEHNLANIAAISVFEAFDAYRLISLEFLLENFKAKLANEPENVEENLLANLEVFADGGDLVETFEALSTELAPALAEFARTARTIDSSFDDTPDEDYDPIPIESLEDLAEFALVYVLSTDLEADLEADFEARQLSIRFPPQDELEGLEAIAKFEADAPNFIAALVTIQERALAGLTEARKASGPNETSDLGEAVRPPAFHEAQKRILADIVVISVFEVLQEQRYYGKLIYLFQTKMSLADPPEDLNDDLRANLEVLADGDDLFETCEALTAELAPVLVEFARAAGSIEFDDADFFDTSDLGEGYSPVQLYAQQVLLEALSIDLDGDLEAIYENSRRGLLFPPKRGVQALKEIEKLKVNAPILIDALVSIQERVLAGLAEARETSEQNGTPHLRLE